MDNYIATATCDQKSTQLLPARSGIYRIVDSAGGFYIGSAVNLQRRWWGHLSDFRTGRHPNTRLLRIWKKDPSRLTFCVVRFCDEADLLIEEQKDLDQFKAGVDPACINVLTLAKSHLGAKRSDETKAKMSAAQKGRTFSAETRAKMRAAKIGKSLSPEHRIKIGNAVRGKPGHPATVRMLACRKYSLELVSEFRRLVADGCPVNTAAKKLNMSRSVARRIVSGKSYVATAPSSDSSVSPIP